MNRQKSTQIDTQKGILGNTIRNSRIEHRLSQEELAKEIGITPTHLKHLESEHRKPSMEVLFKLARTLHFSLDNIIFSQEDTIQMKIQGNIRSFARMHRKRTSDYYRIYLYSF